jgi:hypothetical protein
MEKVSDDQYNGAPSPQEQAQQPRASGQQQSTTGPSGPLQQKIASERGLEVCDQFLARIASCHAAHCSREKTDTDPLL